LGKMYETLGESWNGAPPYFRRVRLRDTAAKASRRASSTTTA